MGRRPNSEQFVDEPLADIGNPSEVHFHGVKVASGYKMVPISDSLTMGCVITKLGPGSALTQLAAGPGAGEGAQEA
jgi:hypothetical protein